MLCTKIGSKIVFLFSLFAGFVPRVVWITLGGYIFFGMYDLSKNFCADVLLENGDRDGREKPPLNF